MKMARLIGKFKRIEGRATAAMTFGKWDKTFEIIKKGDDLINNLKGIIPKEMENSHCLFLYRKANLFENKGYLTLSFEIINELLTVAEKYGLDKYKAMAFHQLGINYKHIGELDKALETLDRSEILYEHCINYDDGFSLALRISNLGNAMRFAIEKGDLDKAKKYFTRLETMYKLNSDKKMLIPSYKLFKAYYLQLSKRTREKARAEELFKQVIEDPNSFSSYKAEAYKGLCNLLLDEMRMTGEMEVIDEMRSIISELIDIAQIWGSERYLMEGLTLQGKLALISFDIKSGKRYLTQARLIAERHGFKRMADEIVHLYDDLLGNLDKWEQMKQNNAPIFERIELAGLNENALNQFRNKIMKMDRVAKEEVTVYKDSKICLVCKGSAGGFNIYVCPICNSIYCKTCAQAVIDLENACWSCNAQIDESKPVKPYKEVEEISDLEISEEIPKKPKIDKKPSKE